MCHVNDDYNEGYEQGQKDAGPRDAEGAAPTTVWLVSWPHEPPLAVCATREFAEEVLAEAMIGSRVQPYIEECPVRANWKQMTREATWTPA